MSSCSSRTARNKHLQRPRHLHRVKKKHVQGHDKVETLIPLHWSRLHVLPTWSPKPFAVLLARRAPSVVAEALAVVASEAVLGVGVCRAGGREASAVLRQVAVPCPGPTDAACRFQLRETQMVVCRLSEESTLARQQTRRRLGRAVTQLASVGCLRRGLANVTYLAVAAALAFCTLCSGSQPAVGGVAAGVLAFLERRTARGIVIKLYFFWWLRFVGACVARTSTLPQSHSSPGSRKAFPQAGPPKIRSVEGESSRQAGLTSSKNRLSCCWLQLLKSCG